MPDIVRNYYDAQWWLFVHLMPFVYMLILIGGVCLWWYQNYYHEDEAEPDVITKLGLDK